MVLQVRVKAGSKFNRIEKDAAGNWLIRIKAPPVEGKANEELIRFIAQKLDLPKSSVQIVAGHASKFKRINVEGMSVQQVEEKFSQE